MTGFRFKRACIRFTWGIVAALAGPVCAQSLLPLADFFKPPAFSDLKMSPSGHRICATMPRSDGRLSLVVLDLQELSRSKFVAGFRDADVWGVEWVNDDRLVFRIYDRTQPAGMQRGTGLFAVNADGGEVPRTLIRPQWGSVRELTTITSRALAPNNDLHSVLRDGSSDVIVDEYVFSDAGVLNSITLKRLDTLTGFAKSLSVGAPKGSVDWTVDRTGVPRAVAALDGGKEVLYFRTTANAEWRKVQERDLYGDGRGIEPVIVDADNRLYASARVSPAADTASLVVTDLASGSAQLRELLSTPGFDFKGRLVMNAVGAVLGVHYLTDARATLWFDAGMKKIQDQVDALLPATINVLDCGTCDQRDRMLVTSFADRQPNVYRLFDVASGTLAPIAESRPWIKPKTMAARDMVRIEARDGRSIPVHITKPNGQKGPMPMVVLVHGGPWVRGGTWEWDQASQFLASRGYVVVEPEFRGSTGFGFDHFRAGWKQWGLAMQDDVADAAAWAVQQGAADPKRICIAGASYGGYATLMGLIRNPELFRCGVEWVGVTDIDLMYSITWSDSSDHWKRFGMPRMVGDRQQDAAQLAATSPIQLAGKVTQPLLMAYGSIDVRVPIEHGQQFRDAVRKTNQNVEWIVYSDEGHGWLLPANTLDFWTHVERFLDKNLKKMP